jgi:hypothetical protein
MEQAWDCVQFLPLVIMAFELTNSATIVLINRVLYSSFSYPHGEQNTRDCGGK